MYCRFDKKHWMQCKADDIAEDTYGCDFYDLPSDEFRAKVYGMAEQAYADYLGGEIDRIHDRER